MSGEGGEAEGGEKVGGGEDTSFRSILDEFKTVIKSKQKWI